MPGTPLWTGSFVSLCLPSSRCGCVGGRVHLSPFVSGTALCVDGFICLPPFIRLPLSPTIFWHGSLGGHVVSHPACLPPLSGFTASFVSLCLPLFLSHPRCLSRLSRWTRSFVSLWPVAVVSQQLLVHLSQLSPSLDAPCVLLCLSPVVSQPGSLHLSPIVSQPGHGFLGGRVHVSPVVSLHLSPPLFVSRCWMCLPSFVLCWLPTAFWVHLFSTVSQLGRVQLSPFVSFLLSPSLDAWHGSVGGRIHLSLFVSLHFPRLSRTHVRCVPRSGMCV